MSHRRTASWTLLAGLLFGVPSFAQAQFNRVFASARSGSDLNSCNSITSPCQTLQGAVNQVAAGGAVLILDTGGYGPVLIEKAVTIEAPAGVEAFIHPPFGSGIYVLAGDTDVVVLRGLTLSEGQVGQVGIDYLTGGALHVERCVIQGFQWGIYASRQGGGPPVYGNLYVEDTIVRNCQFYGIGVSSISGSMRATIERSHLVGNGTFGLGAFNNSNTAVWNTRAAGNGTGMSLFADSGQASRMAIARCTVTNSPVSGVQTSGDIASPATLWISDSTVTGNGGPAASNWAGLRQLGISQLLSRVNNTVEANAHDTYGSIGSYSPK
jgi:Right handed beta helix region